MLKTLRSVPSIDDSSANRQSLQDITVLLPIRSASTDRSSQVRPAQAPHRHLSPPASRGQRALLPVRPRPQAGQRRRHSRPIGSQSPVFPCCLPADRLTRRTKHARTTQNPGFVCVPGRWLEHVTSQQRSDPGSHARLRGRRPALALP